MAGDWLPIRLDLPRDPAVLAMSHHLGISIPKVLGGLVSLWCWANEQSRDGHAHGVTDSHVDALSGVTGLAQAMAQVGWLEVSEGGVTFPKFDAWNSKSAKNRLLAAKRQRSRRHAGVTQVSRSQRDKNVTRGEESRGTTTPLPPTGGGDENGKAPKKPWAPKHPRATEVAEYLGIGILNWRPDAKTDASRTSSTTSVKAVDCMLRLDKRDPEQAMEVITWLFRGERGDYAPEGDFDWRPNVLSGSSLRKHFLKLEAKMDAQRERR